MQRDRVHDLPEQHQLTENVLLAATGVCGDEGIVSITVCEHQAGVDESVSRAREWVTGSASDLVEGAPEVVNGEVTVNKTAQPA